MKIIKNMKLGERWWVSSAGVVALVSISVIIFTSPAAGLAIARGGREPAVTEQVMVITTEGAVQDEGEQGVSTTVGVGNPVEVMEVEQNDQPGVGTTVDTIVVQDATGESFEIDPTASSIISKDVEIEITTSENSKRYMADGASAPENGQAGKGKENEKVGIFRFFMKLFETKNIFEFLFFDICSLFCQKFIRSTFSRIFSTVTAVLILPPGWPTRTGSKRRK